MEKQLQRYMVYITAAFFIFGIWNIWQTHKYRKLEYELKKHQLGM